jgi:D-alanyl-D-alanine carboxypeptidase
MVFALSSPADAARRKRSAAGGYTPPYAAMVVDAKTGRTLHAENADALRHPASITKVMTLYLLFEQLERGKIGLDTPLRVSANAASQAPSKLGLEAGETIAAEDAIKALVTKSANDIAVVIAEAIAGTEEEFAEQMTRKARALGMSKSVFRNASGLPDDEQVTTARDLTILARAIQDRFPRYYRYFQTRVFNFAGAAHQNHNKLLGRVDGVDGIKTGFTRASGFNLMTNAKTEDRHIVAVVLGGRSGSSRDRAMASLVQANLPRAFAGARQAPAVAEGPSPVPTARPQTFADGSRGPLQLQSAPAVLPETTASMTNPVATTPDPSATPARKPLDLNSLRPVVASAAGASSTTTPSALPPMRWQTGPQPLPRGTQAYASLQPTSPAAAAALPPSPPLASGKAEERAANGQTLVARAEPAAEPKREASRPATSMWVIQLGATDDEDKARTMLDNAKSRSGRALAHASAFTEKVSKEGSVLYRARFSGFNEAGQAEAACKALKRNGFACFATRS